MVTKDGRFRCAALVRLADATWSHCLLHARVERPVGERRLGFCHRHVAMVDTRRPVMVEGADEGSLVVVHGGIGYVIRLEVAS